MMMECVSVMHDEIESKEVERKKGDVLELRLYLNMMHF